MRKIIAGVILMSFTAMALAKSLQQDLNHQQSAFYQTAIERGFTNYTWLYGLESDYNEVGEEELKTWMIIVDNDCGRHYQAIQKINQYVVYLGKSGDYNSCSGKGRDRVVVLPVDGAVVNRGQFIDRKSYYVFVGFFNGKSSDGFPIKLPLLKQVKIIKNPA